MPLIEQMYEFGGGGGGSGSTSTRFAFLCYAHEDNASIDPRQRWLDRFLQMFSPMVRQHGLSAWSDKEIKIGDNWHQRIQERLEQAKVVVLFISPAFLASDYIATTEVPLLLRRAKEQGIRVLQILVSPSLWDLATFRYPDPTAGPESFALRDLQTANSPERTLIDLSEAEQNRVLASVAKEVSSLIGGDS